MLKLTTLLEVEAVRVPKPKAGQSLQVPVKSYVWMSGTAGRVAARKSERSPHCSSVFIFERSPIGCGFCRRTGRYFR